MLKSRAPSSLLPESPLSLLPESPSSLPLQLTIDLWNTTTPNLWVILTLSFTPPFNRPEIYGTPLHRISFTYRRMQTKYLGHDDIKFYPPIDNRSMEHHYTESLGHPDIKFYSPFQLTFMQMNFQVTGNITFLVFHRKHLCEARVNFEVSSYLADGVPLLQLTIDLQNTTTLNLLVILTLSFPPQSTIDLWKTTTPNKFHI